MQLNAIYQAYVKFTEAQSEPPSSADDLKELLTKANQDPEKVFVSASDGEPFIVHWGAQALSPNPIPTVIAYEANGKNGQRMVMTTMGVMAMHDKEFLNSDFPKGFSPPSSSE